MTAPALLALYDDRLVGHLEADGLGRLTFSYADERLAAGDAFAISISLPLRAGPHGEAGHAFFANLLPEGALREAVCARLGISRDNDAALLRAIGGECAGALSVVAADRKRRRRDEPRYELLDDARLQSFLDRKRTVALLAGGASTRMSLAGAQDKVPVAVLDGRIHLPIGDAPSTHILKLPHADFAHVPANEAFVLGLARQTGMEVAAADLTTRTTPPSLLVERFDRPASDDPWPVTRLHQEDLCQALGLPPTRKYQQEGGPSLVAIVEVLRRHVHDPLLDVQRLLEWQAFNVCVGNADGHGKNLSLLHAAGGVRLAPFYDLLATRQYARLDRRLAMAIGDQRDPDRLARRHWEALAAEIGISGRTVVTLADRVAERCADALTTATAEYRDRNGAQPILQQLPRAIERRAQRLRRSLAA